MSKTLVILNTFYPFARHEDFLANEIGYIKGFDKIIIAPNSIIEQHPHPLYEINSNYKYLVNKVSYRKNFIRLMFKIIFSDYFYKELSILLKSRNFSFYCIKSLISFLLYALNSYNTVNDYLKNNCKNEDVYLYSYWMHASAFVACLLKKNNNRIVKAVTRCHRFDLYEYRSPNGYIPMRKFIYENIDEIHSISNDGIEYLIGREPMLKNKLYLSRLGTQKYEFIKHKKNQPLKLVSCSWVRPVKRIDLIIDALSKCDILVEWTHFGNGEDFEKIVEQVNALKKPNIKINLLGAISNSDVINEYYKNQYDVFINVSSSEGIPVSIMEAMSMGMVIVATAVGGTPEVVDVSNGFLLDKDFETQELAQILEMIDKMSEVDFEKMALASRVKWEKSFSAEKNYPIFYSNFLSYKL